MTKQSPGSAPRAAAAARKMSGAGLLRGIWSPPMTTEKQSSSPAAASSAFTTSDRVEEARARGTPRAQRAASSSLAPSFTGGWPLGHWD